MRSYNPPKKGDTSRIKEAVDLIEQSKKPVIYSGGGVIQNDASEELTALAKLLNFPVTNTLMGLGAFPGSDPQFMGMLGMHCLLYTSPSPRDGLLSRMPSSA